MSVTLFLVTTQVRIPSITEHFCPAALSTTFPSIQPLATTLLADTILPRHFHCPLFSLYILHFWTTGFLLDSWTLRMGPTGCPAMSVRNCYCSSLCSNPEQCSSQHSWLWLDVNSQCASCNPQLPTRLYFFLLCSHCLVISGKTVVLFMKTTHLVRQTLLYWNVALLQECCCLAHLSRPETEAVTFQQKSDFSTEQFKYSCPVFLCSLWHIRAAIFYDLHCWHLIQ